MKLAVGQVWIAHHSAWPQTWWHFQLIAETWWEGEPYFVGLKCGVAPSSMQVVVFDRHGQSVEAGPLPWNFYLTRQSRSKQARAE